MNARRKKISLGARLWRALVRGTTRTAKDMGKEFLPRSLRRRRTRRVWASDTRRRAAQGRGKTSKRRNGARKPAQGHPGGAGSGSSWAPRDNGLDPLTGQDLIEIYGSVGGSRSSGRTSSRASRSDDIDLDRYVAEMEHRHGIDRHGTPIPGHPRWADGMPGQDDAEDIDGQDDGEDAEFEFTIGETDPDGVS